MKKLLYTLALLLPIIVLGQSTDQNYVKSTTYKKAIQTTVGVSDADKIEQVTYYDGLGRPIQTNAYKAGGNSEDIIGHITYDAIGRQAKTHLPYATTGTNPLEYITGAEAATTAYYQANYAADLDPIVPNPFSEIEYEASTLNRVLQQAAPGEDWSLTSGHTVKFDYQTNVDGEVRNYGVNFPDPTNTEAPELVLDGNYNLNELYKTITKDENWVVADGLNRTTEEFKDKLGRTILKRTYNNGIKHDTQYVYDKFGNLTYVLSPKGSDIVVTQNQYTDFNNSISAANFVPSGGKSSPLGFHTGTTTVSLASRNRVFPFSLSHSLFSLIYKVSLFISVQ